jgi:hypothetical protein
MKDNDAYVSQLKQALEDKITQLEKEAFPRLKEQFSIMFSAFQGIQSNLIQKGILHEDPYRYDQKYSEVNTPPEGAFTDQEKTDQMSVRVSQYSCQLDFLINYYQFSFEFLNMDRIKRLIALTRYFNFNQFSVNSTNINTRVLCELLNPLRNGTDQIMSGVIADSLDHLDRASRSIFQILKETTQCHREEWKLSLRQDVMAKETFNREFVVTHQEETLKQIKRRFSETFPGKPFYTELAQEVLLEDFSKDAESLSHAILHDLEVKKEKPKTVKQDLEFRSILIEGARTMAMINVQLADALQKIQENAAILQAERNSLWDKIARALRSLFNPEEKDLFFDLEIIDSFTGSTKHEKLNFSSFCLDLEKKIKNLAAFTQKGNPLRQRMEGAAEDQLFAYLDKNIDELQAIHKKLLALDAFFKNAVTQEDRGRLHGIKLELEGIKNTIIRTNQKKHEYVGQKEEIEQMKKLGIKLDGN